MNDVNKPMPVHNIILEGRKKLSVSGVTDVDRFDENTVLLYTSMGEMTIKGTDLHVNGLSVESGEMSVEGEIKSILYGDPDRKAPLSLFDKIFH